MPEYGNALSVPCVGMTFMVDAEVRSNAELLLALNYAKSQEAYPELLGHSYKVLEGPTLEVYENYEEEPETGELVGVGPIVGFTKQIGWYVNTEVSNAPY
jgi:hypothetical protein